VQNFILSILEEGIAENIVDAVPCLLVANLPNGLITDEDSVLFCEELLQEMERGGFLKKKLNGGSRAAIGGSSEGTLLNSPVTISSTTQNLNVGGISAPTNSGNTFAVVANFGAPDVDKLEREAASCITLDKFLELTHDEDPATRKAALRQLCPCHVKHDVEIFWNRIIEMNKDPDPVVRYQVLHNLCDGSPKIREETVIAALEDMHNDEDKEIRRRVHIVLSNYRKTGKWNIL